MQRLLIIVTLLTALGTYYIVVSTFHKIEKLPKKILFQFFAQKLQNKKLEPEKFCELKHCNKRANLFFTIFAKSPIQQFWRF